MASSTSPNLSTIHAYRHLYRALLQAVQYSSPARFVARNQLRDAFRRGDPLQFNQQRLSRTVQFLQGAARERGLEHRILKNLLQTAYWKAENLKRLVSQLQRRWLQQIILKCFLRLYLIWIFRPVSSQIKTDQLAKQLRDSASTHYDMTLAMLNDSMGLCLR